MLAIIDLTLDYFLASSNHSFCSHSMYMNQLLLNFADCACRLESFMTVTMILFCFGLLI